MQAAQAHTAQGTDTVASVAVDTGAAFTHADGTLYVGPARAASGRGIERCMHCGLAAYADGAAVVPVVESPTQCGYLCTACVGDWYVPLVSGQGDGTWCHLSTGDDGRMAAGAPILPTVDSACATCGDVMPAIGGHTVILSDGYTRHHDGCMDSAEPTTPAEWRAVVVGILQDADVAATVAIDHYGTVQVHTGDAAPDVCAALDAAGIDTTAGTVRVHRHHVGCAAHCTGDAEQGTGAPCLYAGTTVLVAIDCNGAGNVAAHVARRFAAGFVQATGVYGGQALPSILATVPADRVPALHAALRADLPGYGCAAIMSAIGAAWSPLDAPDADWNGAEPLA